MIITIYIIGLSILLVFNVAFYFLARFQTKKAAEYIQMAEERIDDLEKTRKAMDFYMENDFELGLSDTFIKSMLELDFIEVSIRDDSTVVIGRKPEAEDKK